MLGVIKDALDYLKFSDEEDDEDYIEDDYEDELEPKRAYKPKARDVSRIDEKRSSFAQEQASFREEPTENKRYSSRMERTSNNKVVPIRTTPRGMEVCIMKPTSFEDSQDICDMLLTGRAVVVNLEGFDPDDAQRVMDFISGCIYAINGKLQPISKYIFIFSPDNIDISGDDSEKISNDFGFGVPTLNKEF